MTESRKAPSASMSPRGVLARIGGISLRMLAAVALIGGSAAFAGLTTDTPASANDTDCAGVIVVVDLTDIGGKLEVGCAEGDQATGRDALLAAGFTAIDAEGGYICAINDSPDPCPETFDGKFWSYWNASTRTSEWVSYEVGADSSAPVEGSIEGWRYNDGSTPPGIKPSLAGAQLHPMTTPSPTNVIEDNPGGDQSMTSTNDGAEQASNSMLLTFVTVGFLVLIVVLILFFVIRNRRKGSSNA